MPRHTATVGRRAALIDVAARIVRNDGFGAATVKAVTAKAGMSTGLLYSYASGVDELLAEVFRRYAGTELAAITDAVAVAGPSAADRLVALSDTFTVRALRGRRLAWALLAEPVGRVINAERLLYRRSYHDMVEGIVRDGVADGEFPAQSAAITAASLVGAIAEALTGPLSPIPDTPRETEHDDGEVVGAVRAFCLRAVGMTATERNV